MATRAPGQQSYGRITPSIAPFWLTPLFLTALAAGVLFWLALLMLTGHQPDWSWPLGNPWFYLYLAAVVPVLEEWLFRGLIQDYLQRATGARAWGFISQANLYTSLLFAALHLFSHPPLWAAGVVVPSLVFGLFKDRTGGLAAPILLHVFYNAGYFLLFGG